MAAVAHSQPDLHACPPPFSFDLCPTDPAQPLLLFYFYIQSKSEGFLSSKSNGKDTILNVLLLCHYHALALRRELRSTEIYVS